MRTTLLLPMLLTLVAQAVAAQQQERSRALTALRGTVVGRDGAPIASGRAQVVGSDTAAVAVVNGTFAFTQLRPGIFRLRVTALGFLPDERTITLTDSSAIHLDIRLERTPQALDTINTTARARRDSSIISQINAHQRVAAGTVFLPGNTWLEGALFPTDMLRAARGFQFVNPTSIRRIRPPLCPSQRERMDLYLDGTLFVGSFADLNNMVQVTDLLAVEAYPDAISAPPEWRKAGTCAVIAFWTKR